MSAERLKFIEVVNELVGQFEHDVDGEEWTLKRYPKRSRDADRSVFEVTALYLQKGPTRLLLDPIGYDTPGAEAAVDLYLMPTYDPLATLYREGDQWWIHSPFLPRPDTDDSVTGGRRGAYSAKTINHVLNAIAEDAVPSV